MKEKKVGKQSVTFWIGLEEYSDWKALARAIGKSLAETIRICVRAEIVRRGELQQETTANLEEL